MLPNVLKLLRIASKNLKKFMVIFHMNIHLHEFFQIFLSNRVPWRKSFLILCFSPCYLNRKIVVSGASTSRSNWTLSLFGIFFIIFLKMTSNGWTKKKWIWEIRNALIYIYEISHTYPFGHKLKKKNLFAQIRPLEKKLHEVAWD